ARPPAIPAALSTRRRQSISPTSPLPTPRPARLRVSASRSSMTAARCASRGAPARRSISRRWIMARLQEHYENVVRQALMKELSYKNPMQVPRLSKIVINMGVGEATQDQKKLQSATADLTAIAGQKPLITKSRKSIANFKLRENLNIGCKVTLRRD